MSRIVVIGAGQAGAALVAKLRNLDDQCSIDLIGKEDVLPYQRPPLSKKYLLGEIPLERLYLRPESFYSDNNITLHLGDTVTRINRREKSIVTTRQSLTYDHLVLATGSWPRKLPAAIGGELAGVYTMRDLQDADAMAPEMVAGRKVLIVGGGYIGLEAAAVAATTGLTVTLVEMSDRILNRVAAPQTSDYFRQLHQSHGVTLKENTGLKQLIGQDGKVTSAQLSDGSVERVDFVIVGVGIIPAQDLAEAAGLEIENGIAVDMYGRSSDPSIWAIGDCASFDHQGQKMRLESVQNAIDQAEVTAQNILGAKTSYQPEPWFWSDQYNVKLQIAGLNTGYSDVVERAEQTADSCSFWYYKGDTLLAVDAMNAPKAYMVGKRLLGLGKSPPKAAISDPQTDLKSLLKS